MNAPSGAPTVTAVRSERQSSRLTLLLVDDHEAFRSVAREELEAAGIDVIAELDAAAGVVETAAELRPDVALLDIRLPDGDGVELAGELRRIAPDTAVVLTSGMQSEDARERIAAASSGVPFVPKTDLTARALLSLLRD